jgi:hypothetical protein
MKVENKLRKTLMLLSLLLTLSWSSFSQTDTTTSSIVLPIEVAREIAKDLVSGDEAKKENLILIELTEELQSKIKTQSLLTVNLNERIDSYKLIIENKDAQILNHIKIGQTYQRSYLKEKKKRRIWQAVGITSTVVLLLL